MMSSMLPPHSPGLSPGEAWSPNLVNLNKLRYCGATIATATLIGPNLSQFPPILSNFVLSVSKVGYDWLSD